MRFVIEQIALYPPDPVAAIELLTALGLEDWSTDRVNARGVVRGTELSNAATLNFNYQASPDKALELEVLGYSRPAIAGGPDTDWMVKHSPSVSHLGMHVTSVELEEWRKKFETLHVKVAQEVFTYAHTNPVIAGKRIYNYVIFDTRSVLGVDLKFIVRYNAEVKDDK